MWGKCWTRKKGSNTTTASLLTGSGQATHIEKAALLLLKSGMMYFGAYQAGPSKPRTKSETPRWMGARLRSTECKAPEHAEAEKE